VNLHLSTSMNAVKALEWFDEFQNSACSVTIANLKAVKRLKMEAETLILYVVRSVRAF
jgi:hypothetical protein